MEADKRVRLTRDCYVTQVPSGIRTRLAAGTPVTIRQSLGGHYTVVTDEGCMVRVHREDADAIVGAGASRAGGAAPEAAAGPTDERQVLERLKRVFDPEIPVNIVDLGLIYSCRVVPLGDGGNRVEIKMTMTAPGCGMGEVLKADVEHEVLLLPGVTSVEVELVWDPPWDRNMMSEAARLTLGMM